MAGDKGTKLAPALGPIGFARWIWRQLTSMRTALMLLLLLAIVAIPGSFIPQRSVDSAKVETYFATHPKLAPFLDHLGMFNVYGSPWFSAVYLLIMVSLVGCILPRIAVYAKAVRARPPATPRNLDRLAASDSFTTSATPEDVERAARAQLRRWRVDVVADGDTREIAAEKGYLRELGNLVFHICVVVVLVGVAVTNLWGYRGRVLIVEGDGFSNSLAQYNEYTSGALYNPEELPQFTLKLDDVLAKFRIGGTNSGSPKLFRASGTVTTDGHTKKFKIEVNHPLSVDGTDVFLIGQGYAPVVKITDAKGNVAYNAAVPFLPQDATYTSSGVIKVPEAQPEQLGFEGFFIPTAVSVGDKAASQSILPTAANPLLGLFMWTGDLGMDSGTPQSVYVLDTDKMTQIKGDNGKPYRISLSLGQAQDLPGGGTIEFTGLKQWARFQIAATPMVWLPLAGVSLGVLGLMLSLAIRPRRTWIRARRTDSGTVVEVAAIDRLPRDDLPDDVSAFVAALRSHLDSDPERGRP